LEWKAVLGGWIAPLVILAPWLAGNPLLVPNGILGEGVPGAPAIEADRRYDLLNDIVYQILPWELEVRHALSDRRLPFWSDTLEGGSSPWANPQAGVLSPLQMAARAVPIQHHVLATLMLKVLVAFQGTWLLARLVGLSRAASLLAAAGFSLGGGIFSWGLFPVSATAAWVPWLVAGTIRLFRRPGPRVVATTSAITAVLLLSGHPETAAFGGLLAAVCGLSLRRKTAGFARCFGAAALAAVLGFGLAAPHVLPFLALVPDSQRAADTLAEELPSSEVSLTRPLTWFVPGYGGFVVAPAGPHVFGRPYREAFAGPFNWADSEAGYTGLLAFAGAIIALFAASVGAKRRAWPFLGFAIASLLLSAKFLPLAHLLHLVPPLRVPAYSRMLMPGLLALCIAGAFGLDLLLRRRRLGLRRELAVWTGLALAALASLALRTDHTTLHLWLLLAIGFVLARWRPRWGAVLLGAALLADLIPWSRGLLPEGDPGLFYPRTEVMDIIAREAGDPAVSRGSGGHLLLYPNLLSVYNIADFRPHNPLAPAKQLQILDAAFGFNPTMTRYFAPVENLGHPLLDFLGVRIVLGSPAVPPHPALERIDGDRFLPYTLLRNSGALPRWFVPASVEVIGQGDIRRWIAGMTDPGRVAVFREKVEGRGRVQAARVIASRPGRVTLEIPAGGETVVVSSYPWSRGWKAWAGEQRLRTMIVNGAFLGVRVPGEFSRIELRFMPPGFVA
ncbi:MAG TPA: hypothetical protein VIW92_07160, partial [Thermoanaerobaculia bacterium]